MTPFMTAKLGGKFVTVDASRLFVSTLQVILVPVLAGAFLNQFFQPVVKFVSPIMPPFAVTSVAILCGNAIAQSSSAILVCGGEVILAIFVLHASGFFFDYVFSTLIGLDLSSSRTISTQLLFVAGGLVLLWCYIECDCIGVGVGVKVGDYSGWVHREGAAPEDAVES
ncbi:probable sodium/metabolite cotransporter BASS1, chloroplastic [Vigna radiata var. radiata]|uniref:Probable sodium/metabolite cotransporter BASS1, chloroplastic n=1 Tax=Vigna radiata var. radiata TaxID=3916 RepID=A0A1S3TEZ5_VIGRR|nr:probable sodium/metabolite cotransporter BASS1, chloroplastic [Vigna radiata var. radiata]